MPGEPYTHEVPQFFRQAVVRLCTCHWNDESFDDLRPYGIRDAYYGHHLDGVVLDEGVFDLTRADAVARARNDVVAAAVEPEVTILVHVSEISRDQPVADEFLARRVRFVEVFEKHDGMRSLASDVPLSSPRDLVAIVVDDGNDGTWRRLAQRAGLDGKDLAVIADDDVALGLAEALVDAESEFLLRPFK